MNYFRVIVPIPDLSEDIEVLTALMAMNGYDSFEETSSEFIAYITEDDYDEGKLLDIEYLNKYRLDKSLKTEFVPDKNWNELWESNYPSVYITENCLVRAPFHDSDENVAYDIIIKPKMAFGTERTPEPQPISNTFFPKRSFFRISSNIIDVVS